ncbi:polysaccharide biosynthesis protein [Bacillus sp. FJAT-27225]|uniref:putative polysaccharide biosynthesis protein n=1 Tax=Bacillus sp. FJAT-27225 TaxID=1743144 RepID=UPI00080C2BF8|nr:polysaccharide biosynthesis protein [Bacillus sp. FJAT-27225]OCA80680.1 polysaccharide biosynthesis protein [Bacillus sp. FJAT-27225]
MEPSNQAKNLFKGAFILTAAALFTKLLSAGYRIPFQNIAGDVGFYIYQQVYPFYGIAMALATTGFPVVLSKLFAEHRERERQLFAASFLLLQGFGFVLFAILYLGAEYIAGWMGDESLSILLKAVASVFLLFPAISVLRGYFQGRGDMVPTAASQIGEQAIRVATILVIAILFVQQGYSLYYVGAGAMFGSVTGGIFSLIILLLFLNRRTSRRTSRRELFKLRLSEFKRIGALLGLQGLAICISSLLLVFIQLGDALNLYSLLVRSGIDPESAKELKGIFDRGQPLIQLGLTAASTISFSIVPLIASNHLKKNKEFLNGKIKLAIQVTIVIGAGAAAGLWAIVKPTNIMLFQNSSGTAVLAVLSIAILFSSFISTSSAILQSRGVMFFPAAAIFAGFPLKYVLNLVLVPHFGTMGAAWATTITLCMIAIAVGLALKDTFHDGIITVSFMKNVAAALVIMVVFLKLYLFGTDFLYGLESGRMAAALQAVTACLLGGYLYVLIIIRGGAFRADELALFPFGSKLILLLPKDRRRK